MTRLSCSSRRRTSTSRRICSPQRDAFRVQRLKWFRIETPRDVLISPEARPRHRVGYGTGKQLAANRRALPGGNG